MQEKSKLPLNNNNPQTLSVIQLLETVSLNLDPKQFKVLETVNPNISHRQSLLSLL